MKLDILRSISKEGFESQYQTLIGQLGGLLNNNFTNLYNALNNSLTFRDNFNADIKDIRVKVDNSGTPTLGGQFLTAVKGQIDGMTVIRVISVDNNSIYPSSQPFITYQQVNNLVTIKNIAGLRANTLFELRVQVIGT